MNKKSLPKFANHYYDPDVGPFPGLSELSDFECNRIIRESSDKFMRGERKWYYDESYMPTRKRLEAQMREVFVNKGGQAPHYPPHYLWWGGDGFREMMGVDHFKKVSIKFSALPLISFTYPDSMGSMVFASIPLTQSTTMGKCLRTMRYTGCSKRNSSLMVDGKGMIGSASQSTLRYSFGVTSLSDSTFL